MGPFVSRHPVPADFNDLFLGGRLPGLELDKGLDRFPAAGVRDADDGGIGHLGMLVQDLFHLPGEGLHAVRDDHVLLAVGDDREAFLIQVPDVPGQEITKAFNHSKDLFFIISKGSFFRSSVPIEKAAILLDRPGLDLIVSEPHNKTILKDPTEQNKHFLEFGRIRTVSDVHRLSQSLNQSDRAAA